MKRRRIFLTVVVLTILCIVGIIVFAGMKSTPSSITVESSNGDITIPGNIEIKSEGAITLPRMLLTVSPQEEITLYGKNNKKAVINFNGDKVIYSGDLPVDESAKVFFDHVLKWVIDYEGRE